MSKPKKSWQEKLSDSKGLPKIETITGKFVARWGAKEGDTFVIPAPIEVDEMMREVPEGKITTINHIRQKLALKHFTKITCPITTGIFAWIAAHAAEEARSEGKKEVTPWWRTLKVGGVLNEKYPGGIENQSKLLTKEGHMIEQKGKKVMVKDYEIVMI